MSADVLAVLFLLGVVVALPAWTVVCLRRSPYTPLQSGLYFIDLLLTRILWRAEVRGGLPSGQGAVLVANHTSSIDPCFIQLAAGRVVPWMIAREYFQHWAYGWLLRTIKAIPTNRSGIDTVATRQAIRYAAEGGLVGIFPEGRINMSDQFMLAGRPGAAMIALTARVPVVPVYIGGAPYDQTPYGALLMPARVRIVLGSPIDLSPYYGRGRERDVLQQLTLKFMSEIARLAGVEEFQPQLASRRWNPSHRELKMTMAQSVRRKRTAGTTP